MRRTAWAQPRIALVGTCDPELESVIDEVAIEVGACLGGPQDQIPAAVVAIVTAKDVVDVLTAARLLHSGVAIVAIMGVGDERVFARAAACGATACHGLDLPLDHLRAIFAGFIRSGSPVSSKS